MNALWEDHGSGRPGTLGVPGLTSSADEGIDAFLQFLQLDDGASHGTAFSPGLRLRLGW